MPPNDARIEAGHVTYAGASGAIRAYLARPKGTAKLPAIVVVHENRGLTPHIEDVARRAAVAGFVALAPDLLSPLGGAPADEDAARQLFAKVNPATALADPVAGLSHLNARANASARWPRRFARARHVQPSGCELPSSPRRCRLRQPAAADISKIKAKLLLHYAGNDDRVNAGITAYQAALKAAWRTTPRHVRGYQHAFTTPPAPLQQGSRRLAWRRTVGFSSHA